MYDTMGRRVAKKVDSGAWKWYFYDGLRVVAEGTGTGDREGYYDNFIEAYTMDAFGNVLEVTNGSYGYYYSYDFNPGISPLSYTSQPNFLTGKEYDADVGGLYYFNARWYDSVTGHFVSRTPVLREIEEPYQYSQNNPANETDPDGLLSTKGRKAAKRCWERFQACLKHSHRWKVGEAVLAGECVVAFIQSVAGCYFICLILTDGVGSMVCTQICGTIERAMVAPLCMKGWHYRKDRIRCENLSCRDAHKQCLKWVKRHNQ